MKLWKTNLKIHLGVLGTGNIKLFKNTVFYRVSFRSITKRKFVLLNEQLERQIVQNAYEEMNVNSEWISDEKVAWLKIIPNEHRTKPTVFEF